MGNIQLAKSAPILPLFEHSHTRERQIESWNKTSPQVIRSQREKVLIYLYYYPKSTHLEIWEGLGKECRSSSIQRALSNLGKESPMLIDTSESKLNKEGTRNVTAYQLNEVGINEVKQLTKVKK